jgi:hypothetical protein
MSALCSKYKGEIALTDRGEMNFVSKKSQIFWCITSFTLCVSYVESVATKPTSV